MTCPEDLCETLSTHDRGAGEELKGRCEVLPVATSTPRRPTGEKKAKVGSAAFKRKGGIEEKYVLLAFPECQKKEWGVKIVDIARPS